VGGTLFAIIAAGTLLHPAVARAYTVLPLRSPQEPPDEVSLGDAAGDACGGKIMG
jgi:hypothetical protein